MGNCVGAEENEWEFKTIDEVKRNKKDVSHKYNTFFLYLILACS